MLRAGSDGTFDDGNEIPVTVTAVTYDSAAQTAILTLPQSITGTSELDPDDYRLTVLASGSIADAAGNIINQSTSEDFSVVPAETIHNRQRYSFTSVTGDKVTVLLIGPGDAQILLGEPVGTENTIEKISLTNTTKKTRLLISARRGSNVSVGQILSDSALYSIQARNVAITSQITVQQNINKLYLGNIATAAALNLQTTDDINSTRGGISIFANTIGQDVTIDIDGRLKMLNAQSYQGGTLTADSAGSILITRGDLAADIEISQGDLNQLNVRSGNLNGDLLVNGRVNRLRVSAGQITSNLQANEFNLILADQLQNCTIRSENDINRILSKSGSWARLSAANDLNTLRLTGNLQNSTISAGRNLTSVTVTGDAIDNLFLAGANLGSDSRLNGVDEQFGDGDIVKIKIRGSFTGSVGAAGINPGSDLQYFTDDDASASSGNINRIIFGRSSLDNTIAAEPFGLLASGNILPFRYSRQIYQAPLTLDQFHLQII